MHNKLRNCTSTHFMWKLRLKRFGRWTHSQWKTLLHNSRTQHLKIFILTLNAINDNEYFPVMILSHTLYNLNCISPCTFFIFTVGKSTANADLTIPSKWFPTPRLNFNNKNITVSIINEQYFTLQLNLIYELFFHTYPKVKVKLPPRETWLVDDDRSTLLSLIP